MKIKGCKPLHFSDVFSFWSVLCNLKTSPNATSPDEHTAFCSGLCNSNHTISRAGRDPRGSSSPTPTKSASSFESVQLRINQMFSSDTVNSPELLSLFRIPAGNRVLLSLIGWLLPTRSSRPAAAAQESRMKQATVEVKSFTSIVWKNKKQQLLLWYSMAFANHRGKSDVSSGSRQIDVWIYFTLSSLSRLKDTSLFVPKD